MILFELQNVGRFRVYSDGRVEAETDTERARETAQLLERHLAATSAASTAFIKPTDVYMIRLQQLGAIIISWEYDERENAAEGIIY